MHFDKNKNDFSISRLAIDCILAKYHQSLDIFRISRGIIDE